MMCLILAYKRVKTMKNPKRVIGKKSGRGHLRELSNCSDLTGKILVFWIGGSL